MTKQLHDFAVRQLLVFSFDLALFAEDKGVLAIRIAMHIETLQEVENRKLT